MVPIYYLYCRVLFSSKGHEVKQGQGPTIWSWFSWEDDTAGRAYHTSKCRPWKFDDWIWGSWGLPRLEAMPYMIQTFNFQLGFVQQHAMSQNILTSEYDKGSKTTGCAASYFRTSPHVSGAVFSNPKRTQMVWCAKCQPSQILGTQFWSIPRISHGGSALWCVLATNFKPHRLWIYLPQILGTLVITKQFL